LKSKLSIIALIGTFTFVSAEPSFIKTCQKPNPSDLKTLKALKQDMYISLPKKYSMAFKKNDCKIMYKYLQSVTEVGLSGNQADKVSSVTGYPDLHQIDWIDDVSLLRYFPNLKKVDLSTNEIKSLKPLEKMAHLTELDVISNPVTDFSPLVKLKNLERLEISNSKISDIAAIGQILSLKSLTLYSDGIKDISPLGNLVNLEKLTVSSDEITDICALDTLVNLKELDISGCSKVTDISCLKDATQLEKLNIKNTAVKKIDVVKNYKNLVVFNGNDTIQDMSSLVGLEKLTVADTHSAALLECSPQNIDEIKSGKSCSKKEDENGNKSWWKKVLGL
jgi:internalin A